MDRLWAPWRMKYIEDSTMPKNEGCFLCQTAICNPENAAANLLLGKGEGAFVMFNRFPYNNGHLMIAPFSHVGNVEEVSAEEAAEMWRLLALAKLALAETMSPDGFNIGINQGKCAGAGVTDHIHIHIVPRWNGDTNFMPVTAETKVMPQSLEELHAKLRPAFLSKGLK